MTLNEFVGTYMDVHVDVHNRPSTKVAKEQKLNRNIITMLGHLELDKITKLEVAKFTAHLKTKCKLSNKTINNYLSDISIMLTVACDHDLIENVPRIKRLKLEKPEFDYLSESEAKRLFRSADSEWARRMFQLFVASGLRIGEMRALRWANIIDLDGPNPSLRLTHTYSGRFGELGPLKDNECRTVTLGRLGKEAIQGIRRFSEFVFGDHTLGLGDMPRGYESILGSLERAAKAAGIRRITPHALRHTFASLCVKSGVSIERVQKLMGHSDIRITMRYAHLRPDDLREATDQLDLLFHFAATAHNKA